MDVSSLYKSCLYPPGVCPLPRHSAADEYGARQGLHPLLMVVHGPGEIRVLQRISQSPHL